MKTLALLLLAVSANALSIKSPSPNSGTITPAAINSSGNINAASFTSTGAAVVGSVTVGGTVLTANVVSGNVGIGTTSPNTKFQCSSCVVTIDGSGAGLTVNGATYIRPINFNGTGIGMQTNGVEKWVIDNAPSGFGLYNNTQADYAYFVTPQSAMGIKTNNPATTLDVNGSAQFGSGATKSTFTATGALTLPNNTSYQALNTVGVAIPVAQIDAGNNILIGHLSASGANTVIIKAPTGVNAIYLTSNGIVQFQTGAALLSQTVAQLVAKVPALAGESYYCSNCVPPKAVISTGTAAGNFADFTGGTFK